ncbi:hypothetical protein TARUN_1349 [Trichoderma arundinaceum]|uniref:Uncharacterized protein n=1 Tax=Trichoderma arundinaceum TaxID=490622 RepID=A0A395NXY0_TRIAR|nr:hypothetical protein TARUN_1349 [Trichoderma arundinaceum]
MSANSFYFAGQQPASQAPSLSINAVGDDINSDSLASNNPFRNHRTASPSFPTTPTSPFADPMPSSRPLSRNPFLDQPVAAPRPAGDVSATVKTQSLTAEDIFVRLSMPLLARASTAAAAGREKRAGSLTLDDSPAFSVKQPVDSQLMKKRPTDRPAPPRRESESQASGRAAENKHRPTRSQEEALRARKPPPKTTTRPSLLDDSPPRKPVQRRPRRNSDSSVMDFDAKSLTAEEKRMIEAKRRERGKGSKPGRPSRKMDIIDQLDATSIYGTGLFHHDGPFDALNPHRNRQNSKKLSPMQAFPEGSLNNTLGGSGPLNAQADHSAFMGHGNDEAFRDYAASGKSKKEPIIFDAQARGSLVHGDESHGLGTSTFLEGTPAARSAIVRRQVEQAQEIAEGGLQRKKSLAQRIRQRTRPDYSNRPMPGHGRYDSDDFGEYSKGDERARAPRPPPREREREGRLSPPPMPRRNSGSAVEQRTNSGTLINVSDEAPAKPSGLLGRMKTGRLEIITAWRLLLHVYLILVHNETERIIYKPATTITITTTAPSVARHTHLRNQTIPSRGMSALHQQALPSNPPDPSRPKPVSASALASIEKRRRELVRSLGPCRSGCGDLDDYVLLGGGFERGSVVGISAEEEDAVGVTLGLQVLVCSLLDKSAQKVQIVTPKPPSTIVVLLKNGITAELRARGVTALDDIAAQRRDCLDRIMLSRVFDMDGLSEVLADLDAPAAATAPVMEEDALKKQVVADAQPAEETLAAQASVAAVTAKAEEPPILAEIQDSQDDEDEIQDSQDDQDEALSPLQPLATAPQPSSQDKREQSNPNIADREVRGSTSGPNTASNKHSTATTAATPDIILITHFSSLLTSFFTQRDKSAAHAALRLLASRLRRLSRTLPSSPLILLINSTDSGIASATVHPPEPHSYDNPPPPEQPIHNNNNNNNKSPAVDPTLRSIFNPVHAAAPPYGHSYKTNKPTFGLVFTQLLDLHLLCTRAPRPSKAIPPRAMTVAEVLLDDIGVWEGERGRRRRREQRWTIVSSHNGRIAAEFDGERQR